jgi:hypothetical protein
MQMNLNSYMPVKLVTGAGCVRASGKELAKLGKTCLIVTGKTSAKACGALQDVTDTLDSNKDITAKYYLKPTYTIIATYTTVTDGVSSSEVVTSSGKDEVGVPVPFTQSDYDNMVSDFTEEHFLNDLQVNGTAATTMPTMEKMALPSARRHWFSTKLQAIKGAASRI